MTNSLCPSAKEGHLALPCLWLRGLTPWDHTWGRVEEVDIPQFFFSEGPWLALPSKWTLPLNAIAGIDGSGGEHSADPGSGKLPGVSLLLHTNPSNPLPMPVAQC